ncbi:MAG: ABC transporter permease [Micrococcales bacterium]|nr:ABC transporter permease [Micrococcales bacterium]
MTVADPPAPRVRRSRAPGTLAWLGAIPLGVWMLLFFLLPFGLIVWYSFGYKPDIYSTVSNDQLSLGRYAQALSPAFLQIFWRTLGIAVIGTVIAGLIAYPMAYWMAVVVPPRWRGLVLALVLVPYWTNFLVRTLGWSVLLSGSGPLSTALQAAGGQPLAVLNTSGAVQLGVVYNYLPLMILPIYVALDRLDPRLLEASRDLGANAVRTFWRITLPLSAPGVTAGTLLVFVPLMGDYITPAVLGGAKGSMVGQMVAGQFTNAQNWALGSAMAILLMVAIFGVTAIAGAVVRGLSWTLSRATRLVPLGGRA